MGRGFPGASAAADEAYGAPIFVLKSVPSHPFTKNVNGWGTGACAFPPI